MTLAAPPRVLVRRLLALRGLPRPVALFQARVLLRAMRLGDAFTVISVARPNDVRALLRVGAGRRHVVELGTATGVTAASLVLADPQRTVTTFDVVERPHRDAYLALLPATVRARIALVPGDGAAGAAAHEHPVELLFVDSSHERDATVAELEAWRPRLAPGAAVVLHDYENPEWPGVREAAEDLGLTGRVESGMLVIDPYPR